MKVAKKFLKQKERKKNIKAQFMGLVGNTLPIVQNAEPNVMNTSLFLAQKRSQACQIVVADVALAVYKTNSSVLTVKKLANQNAAVSDFQLLPKVNEELEKRKK